jgi:phosphonate transport system permease protein
MPSRKARRIWRWTSGLAIAMVGLTAALGVNPLDLITQFHHIADLADRMFPPRWEVLADRTVWLSIIETLAMAFLGALGGCTLGFLAGLLGASNATPHPAVRVTVRSLMAIERAITQVFVLMIMLIALGIGPFASAVTLVVATVGLFGRLFADAIEQAEAAPCESLIATGATRIQVIAFGILPQVMPSLLALALFAFEVNLRVAIVLGLFGGGGLGFQLHVANMALRYQDVLGYSIVSVLLVTLVERVSDRIRKQLLGT